MENSEKVETLGIVFQKRTFRGNHASRDNDVVPGNEARECHVFKACLSRWTPSRRT